MKFIAFVMTFALVLGSQPALPASESAEVRWGNDAARAMSEAKSSGKPVLVDVWAVRVEFGQVTVIANGDFVRRARLAAIEARGMRFGRRECEQSQKC